MAGRGAIVRLVLAPCLVAMLGCSSEKEPTEPEITQAIERMHQEWAVERRQNQKAQVPDLYRRLPNVNLAFEANLALRITSVRKVWCKRSGDEKLGYNCRVVVGASLAGRSPVIQNIEGRFVQGLNGWIARDVMVLEGAPG
jgi:hypothetical protein